MSHDDSLPPDIASLLQAGRAVPGAEQAVRDRLLARLRTTLVLPGAPPPGHAHPGSHAPSVSSSPPPAAPPLAGHGVAQFMLRPLPLAVTMFALGAGAGATLHATLTAGRPAASSSVRATPPDAIPAPDAGPVDAPPSGALPDAEITSGYRGALPVPPADDSLAVRDGQLAAERSLLEMARTALGRGDCARALEPLEDHAAKHPRGKLAEEREVLRVRTLACAGRMDEARSRAASFRERFPKSIFLPVIEQVLVQNPTRDAPDASNTK